MLQLAADENLNNDIVRGLKRRDPLLDIVRIQDTGLSGATDPELLAWAAREGRVLLTHDVSTLTRFAYERVKAGLPMPGVIEVSRAVPMGSAIEDILLLAISVFPANGKGGSSTCRCEPCTGDGEMVSGFLCRTLTILPKRNATWYWECPPTKSSWW
jgi:hypothetical protein